MTVRTAEYRVHKAPREGPARRLLEGAPRQPAAEEAWKDFTLRLVAALTALEEDLRTLLGLGWRAPTQVPGTSRGDADGSPNYHIDLARPVPLEEVAAVVVITLRQVHGAGHPGMLEYEARSTGGVSIRFPHLLIRPRGRSGN